MTNSELDSGINSNQQGDDFAGKRHPEAQISNNNTTKTDNLVSYAHYLKSPSKKYYGGSRRDSCDSSDSSSDDESVTERRPIAKKKGNFASQAKKEENTQSKTFYRELVSQKSIEVTV